MVSVVMYHYVRDVEITPYPGMYARSRAEFSRQLDWLQSNLVSVPHGDLVDAFAQNSWVPENSFYLTFDDGLKDHYYVALNELKSRNLSASFFVSLEPLRTKAVLDVHKLQLLLGSQDHAKLVNSLRRRLGSDRFDSYQEHRRGASDPSRYDNESVLLFKRLLQRDLEQPLRSEIVDGLFREFITEDVASVSQDLYLTIEEIREMRDAGMVIGSHTRSHPWLSTIDHDNLISEILETQDFLEAEKLMSPDFRTIAYPYGDHNDDVVDVLDEQGYVLAFTTKPEVADPIQNSPLRVPRLDTNDFAR